MIAATEVLSDVAVDSVKMFCVAFETAQRNTVFFSLLGHSVDVSLGSLLISKGHLQIQGSKST